MAMGVVIAGVVAVAAIVGTMAGRCPSILVGMMATDMDVTGILDTVVAMVVVAMVVVVVMVVITVMMTVTGVTVGILTVAVTVTAAGPGPDPMTVMIAETAGTVVVAESSKASRRFLVSTWPTAFY